MALLETLRMPETKIIQLSIRRIFKTWWPLAASWLLMGIETPILSAAVARLANPEINLAAYGGVVFPLAMIIESPIIMLLAASTALSKDWASYAKLRRFMLVAGVALTSLHVLVAFSPLYYVVVVGIIGAPEAIVEPARYGLMIMTPWTWSIAFRRFNQGVLIRFGHSQTVSIGTIVRLSMDALVLTIGYWLHNIPGVVVATSAIAMGVMSEALYIGIVVRSVIRSELRLAPRLAQALTWADFFRFYLPLVMTSLLTLLAQPIGSAAISRMPQAIESLAVWPVISGLIFMFRSLGLAFNEVVVALLDERQSAANLQRFAAWLGGLISLAMLVLTVSPLAEFWFGRVSALAPDLAAMAKTGLWIALPMPLMAVLQSWYQGVILHGRNTRGITEAVVVYLVSIGVILFAGAAWGRATGLFVGIAAISISMVAQTIWLRYRSRAQLIQIFKEDQTDLSPLAQPVSTD